MIDQTIKLATRIFFYIFFYYQALFAFDNTANHAYIAENTSLAKKINLEIGRI